MRILIVDDSALMRTQMRIILATNGHEVLEASDVTSAVAIFCKEQPDFVFSDLNLAGESGMAFFSEISLMFPDVPFVLVTVSRDEKELKAALAMGMRDVVQKPVAPDTLLKLLQKHRPSDGEKRLVKLSLTVEARIMDKARELACKTKIQAEKVIQDFLHESFSTSEGTRKSIPISLEGPVLTAALEASTKANVSLEDYLSTLLKKTLVTTGAVAEKPAMAN